MECVSRLDGMMGSELVGFGLGASIWGAAGNLHDLQMPVLGRRRPP